MEAVYIDFFGSICFFNMDSRAKKIEILPNFNTPIPSIMLQLANNHGDYKLSSIVNSCQIYITPYKKKNYDQ